MRLRGKKAVITGGGSDIGRATAVLFAAEGADVVVANLERDDAEQTAEAVRELGRKAAVLIADLSDADATCAMIEGAIAELGGIDILVNNGGVGKVFAPTLDLTDMDAWDHVMAVNVRAAFICSQQAARWMSAHDGGKIVNVGSQTGVAGVPGVNVYGPSKAALHNMTRSQAVEWAKHGINVNCVAPCWTRTRRLEAAIERGVTSWDEIAKRCPMGRAAEPEDVAKAILFLASSDADFITGVTLPVDGGWLAFGYQAV